MTNPRGREAYRLYVAGLTWEEAAARVGYTAESTARHAARAFAERTGEPWPAPRVTTTRARRAYDLYATEEYSWAQVADRVGYGSCSAAYGAARRHAAAMSLPWPLPAPTQRRARRAYDLYVKGTHTWAEVAEALGYGSVNGVHAAAQRHAEETGRPWPPQRAEVRDLAAYRDISRRNAAIDRWRRLQAARRRGRAMAIRARQLEAYAEWEARREEARWRLTALAERLLQSGRLTYTRPDQLRMLVDWMASGDTQHELAKRWGVSPSAAEKRLQRARVFLMEHGAAEDDVALWSQGWSRHRPTVQSVEGLLCSGRLRSG